MNFTMTPESILLVLSGQMHTVLAGTPQYVQVSKAILSGDWGSIEKLLTFAGSLQQYLGDKFTVADGGNIMYKGHPVPPSVNARIAMMIHKGESPEPLFKFYERLDKNPSFRSVTQLFDFLKHNGIPLEPTGTFLAYKKVRADFKDVHSGTIDNSPGQVVEMERNQISDDSSQTCHVGLHVGAPGYMGHFGGTQIVICRVDPENVVCVPDDYDGMKMRVCKYEVIGLYSGTQMPSTVVDDEYASPYADYDGEFNDDDSDEDDDSTPQVVLDAQTPGHPNYWAPTPDPIPAKKSQFRGFGTMDTGKLMKQSIESLRKYASGKLKLVGASKMPGGKSALVSKIMKLRKKAK